MTNSERREVPIPYCKFQSSPTNSKWGYYNIKGEKISDFSFRYCEPFNGDYAVFGDYKTKNYPNLCYGLINRNFDIVHPPIFKRLSSVSTRINSFEGFIDTPCYNYDAVYLNMNENILLTGAKIYIIDCGLIIVERHYDSISCFNSKGSLIFSRPLCISDSKTKWYCFDKIIDYGSNGFCIVYSNIEAEEINISMWRGEEAYDTFYTTHIKKIFFDTNGNVTSQDSDSFTHEVYNNITLNTNKFNSEKSFLEDNNLISLSYIEILENLISEGLLYEDDYSNLSGFRLYQSKDGLKFWSEETSLPKVVAYL